MKLNSIKDLGHTTNMEVVNRFVSLESAFVVDAGCGDMVFTQHLLGQGARVLAIDPDPVQASKNRDLMPVAGLEFVETGADSLPVGSNCIDGVFFAYSLHHVPADLYPGVFREVVRVLKPDGFLYVIEPADCPLNEVMKLFHDEDRERAEAQQALVELAVPEFKTAQVVTYHGYSRYDSFEQFAEQFGNRTFNSIYSSADVRRPAVREAFERLGGVDHRFASPKLVMFLQGLKS